MLGYGVRIQSTFTSSNNIDSITSCCCCCKAEIHNENRSTCWAFAKRNKKKSPRLIYFSFVCRCLKKPKTIPVPSGNKWTRASFQDKIKKQKKQKHPHNDHPFAKWLANSNTSQPPQDIYYMNMIFNRETNWSSPSLPYLHTTFIDIFKHTLTLRKGEKKYEVPLTRLH